MNYSIVNSMGKTQFLVNIRPHCLGPRNEVAMEAKNLSSHQFPLDHSSVDTCVRAAVEAAPVARNKQVFVTF